MQTYPIHHFDRKPLEKDPPRYWNQMDNETEDASEEDVCGRNGIKKKKKKL